MKNIVSLTPDIKVKVAFLKLESYRIIFLSLLVTNLGYPSENMFLTISPQFTISPFQFTFFDIKQSTQFLCH